MKRQELLRRARLGREDPGAAEELGAALESRDLELIAQCLQSTTDEQVLRDLIRVLASVPRAAIVDCSPEIRRALTMCLAPIVRSDYPSALSRSAFLLWRKCDRASAEAFLFDEFDLRSAMNDSSGAVVVDLTICGGERARHALEQLAVWGGASAAFARQTLDIDFPSAARMRLLRDEWLANKTPKNLTTLYHAFMIAAKTGVTTKAEIVSFFGMPSDASGSTIWYSPSEGTSLSFHFDESDRLEGSHLT